MRTGEAGRSNVHSFCSCHEKQIEARKGYTKEYASMCTEHVVKKISPNTKVHRERFNMLYATLPRPRPLSLRSFELPHCFAAPIRSPEPAPASSLAEPDPLSALAKPPSSGIAQTRRRLSPAYASPPRSLGQTRSLVVFATFLATTRTPRWISAPHRRIDVCVGDAAVAWTASWVGLGREQGSISGALVCWAAMWLPRLSYHCSQAAYCKRLPRGRCVQQVIVDDRRFSVLRKQGAATFHQTARGNGASPTALAKAGTSRIELIKGWHVCKALMLRRRIEANLP